MSYSPFIQPSLSENLLHLNLPNITSSTSPDHLFKTLLNSKSSNKPLIIQSLNILLESITTFDDNCSKYFSYLNDAFKSIANTIHSTLPPYNEIIIINSSISAFIKHFHMNYITYNDKHKSISKQFPSFISLFIKLFKSNISFLLSSSTIDTALHAIESYFIVILTFINLYPSLLRSHQKVIEDTIEHVFTLFITEHTLTLRSITTFIIVYAALFYLSPTPHSKFNTYLDNIINAINTSVNYYQPRTLDNETSTTTNVNANDSSLLLLRVITNINDNTNVTHSIKIIDLLFDILKHVFILIQPNTLTVVNYNTMLSCFNNIIDNITSTQSNIIDNKSNVIVNGLQRDNYKLFSYNIINNILTTMNFQCKYYTKYIYKYYTALNTFINKTIMNHHIQSNYETYMSLLSLYETFIYNYSAVYPHIVDDIVYKMIYNSFPRVYFDYLVASDKTIINIQDTYFKVNTKKHKNNNNNNTGQTVVKSDWSKDKQTMVVKMMLYIVKAYFSVEHYSMVKNWKNMLSGIVECLVLPSYAKFIFGLDEDVKKEIVCVVDCAVSSGKCVVDKERVGAFLNGFYVERSDLQYICRDVIRKLNVNVGESGEIGYIKMRNDFTGEIVDLNRKIKEIVEEEVKWEKERMLLGRKRKYEDDEGEDGNEDNDVNNKPKAQDKEKQRTHNTRNVNKIHNKVNDNNNDDNIIITRKDDNDVKCSQEEQILQIEHKEDNNININITKSLNEEANNDNNDIAEDDDDDDLVIPDIN